MSVDGTKLLFEGFLQKRKDTLKIRWVTYWFRLQNTTLFFYTKKNGGASHLRGYYYIYTVQSVREVQRTDKKHFLFEIVMTNGKKKMLAAETAALRKEWVGHLWQAMHLSTSGLLDSRDPDLELFDQRGSLSSNMSVSLCSDSVREVQPTRPLSVSSEHIYSETEGLTSSIRPPEDEDSDDATYQNLRRPLTSDEPTEDPERSSMGSSSPPMSCEEQQQDGLYDVLPARKSTCEALPTQTHDAVYDFPLSYKTSSGNQDGVYDVPVSDHKGGIYDVPTSLRKDEVYDVPAHLLRKKGDHTEDEQPEGETYWRI
ncbi:uncharacterized protein LOC129363214 [Poeciliopsis prolifica]|uniref:uncharacterized protein LOC129363214 n=1 Tax=Poeciliopsis prolifica TaxID=188132 RepID=UPI00241309FB|nr:uncharacterized protein LOC129363214 [Poeciliopsis prolifica]XP_054891144.1 uncharacterized protein LOC129363214 [Poeciliopsis prolifica]